MTKSTPFFSIVIPTLNEEECLPRLLADLARQSYCDFEVIVVDAHSNDKTISQAKKLTRQLPCLTIINSRQRNVAHQRNLGAKKARGKILIFMDADNQLPPYFLLGIKYRLELNKPQLFTCYLDPDSTKPQDKTVASLLNLSSEIQDKIIDAPMALGALIGCKKAFFSKIGGFDESIVYAEDREFSIRAFKQGGRFQLFKDPKYAYSFRRLRKEGKLKLLQKLTKTGAMRLLQGYAQEPLAEYPMLGGRFYDKPRKKSQLPLKLKILYHKIADIIDL
ncbi:glycosyltransferase [Patescibacteria group bacterium]|nr:glycosyltransferase [Patescibacteria group bacterium]MBU1931552.1 glycosyltransferase [Patescibacteria group bacterium]